MLSDYSLNNANIYAENFNKYLYKLAKAIQIEGSGKK